MDYDAYPIKVFTAYTLEEMRAVQKVMFRYVRFVMWMIAAAFGVIAAISFFGSLVAYGEVSYALLDSLPMLAFVILFLLLSSVFSGRWYSKRRMEADENMKYVRHGVQFFFRSQGMEAFNNVDGHSKYTEKRYADITKVLETKDAFYICFGGIQYIIISKNGFSSGTPEDLAALLRKAVTHQKYKVLQ